jgi:GcrA cell cycle regulator
MSRFWTAEKVERLRAEWMAGTAVNAIAALLGGSRNAVIGKAHRLELPMHPGSLFHPDKARTPGAQKKLAQRKPAPKRVRRRRVRLAGKTRKESAPLSPPVRGPAPARLRIPFAALEPHHCRYAVTDAPPHFFCGALRREKSAFCAFHHALCHEPRRETEDRKPRSRAWRSVLEHRLRARAA